MPKPKPLWRWWLFGVAFMLAHRTRWRWPIDLMAWCVLPEWLGHEEPPPSALHCWVDHPDGGATCMLPDGHRGAHEWTRDSEIGVTFAAPEADEVPW